MRNRAYVVFTGTLTALLAIITIFVALQVSPSIQAQDADLPATEPDSMLTYLLETNPYTEWGTWPDDGFSDFSEILQSEAPHGESVRIFVNDIALSVAETGPEGGMMPFGSIIVKENFNGPPDNPGPLDSLTIMYKVEGFNPDANDWYWLKATVSGEEPVIDASGMPTGCIECHSQQGNNDFLLRYNFGDEPAVTYTVQGEGQPPEPAQTEEAMEEEGDMAEEEMSDEAAQMGDFEVIADGFNNPRGMFYGPDGMLYVTDAGTGGDVPLLGVLGEGMAGGTSTVSAIAPDGTQTYVAVGLPSFITRGEVLGTHDVYVTGDSVWLALGQISERQGDTAHAPFAYAVAAMNPDTLGVTEYIDIYAYEVENNPDGGIIDSNPVNIDFAEDGTLYIADAGANAIFSWTPEGGLQTFKAWSAEENPVPTSVFVGPEGDVYVSFLTGFPFTQGASRVEQLSPDGETVATYEGLSTVVDVLVGADGTIYATQFGSFDMEEGGWQPNTGSVVTVSQDGPTELVSGVTFPYGLAMDADGQLVASINAAYQEAANGTIIVVPMP